MKKFTLIVVLSLLSVVNLYGQTCQTASITASTPTSRFTDNGDGTLVDSVTGLMWKKCSEGQSYNTATSGCDGTDVTYSWQEALQRASAANSGGGFAGHTDWRLPDIKELNSIVERQCINPAINLDIFPATSSWQFWSASPYADASVTDGAWLISFDDGHYGIGNKSNGPVARLVRGGQ